MLLLADEDGAVRGRYASLVPVISAAGAFVFLLDRWGAPLAAGAIDDAPSDWVPGALGWFDLAQARCPE